MSQRSHQKQKARRKAVQQEKRRTQDAAARKGKAVWLLEEARWFRGEGDFSKALGFLKAALKNDPNNSRMLVELANLARQMKDVAEELKALYRLHETGKLDDRWLPGLIHLLADAGRFEKAQALAGGLLERLPSTAIPAKRRVKKDLEGLEAFCRRRILETTTEPGKNAAAKKEPPKPPAAPGKVKPVPEPAPAPEPAPTAEAAMEPPAAPVRVPVFFSVDTGSFEKALSTRAFAPPLSYEVALEGHRIQFRDAFENLICLSQLKEVRSLWYQEETARKVLKQFRGRALLSDEVGLGKTIEAGMVLKEYIQRGMVKTALILTPTPLVSQWKEELSAKFEIDLPSTDDPDFRKKGADFWQAPMVLASINQAKSAKNHETVTAREYDIVIVDEAHHLKNKATVNWKLVNALKKRFLLLLTATPVENNLMELYNLITLLKPGQLKTASAFREEFMTRGDPTSPQNRERLKELLGQVMIRNTRAIARLNIPPRFARTIRIDPGEAERAWYEELSDLVRALHKSGGRAGGKLLLKNLLAEAGSSPEAAAMTLSRLVEKEGVEAPHLPRMRSLKDEALGLDATGKNRTLLKLIRSSPDKVIVFVKYLATLDHVSRFLTANRIGHALFHGGMVNAEKERQIAGFKGEKPVLVTTEIGGEGRNLQFCHRMVNYDLPWNPMKIEQRIGRIHRIGQTKEVQIDNLCGAGSVEDYILEILDRKINMFEMVIGEIDMVLGRVQGEKDFSELVYDIWVETESVEERKKGFDALARRVKRSRSQYEATRTLDEQLFGENYEL